MKTKCIFFIALITNFTFVQGVNKDKKDQSTRLKSWDERPFKFLPEEKYPGVFHKGITKQRQQLRKSSSLSLFCCWSKREHDE